MAQRPWHDLGSDLRLALRGLFQRPAFAAVALVTLALGIGAPTAIFSVVHAVLLRPLPYPEPDRLVRFRLEMRGPRGSAAFDALPASSAIEWGAHTTTLAGLGLFNERALTLATLEGPFRLAGVAVTPNLFDLLGVAPVAGRTLDATSTDGHHVVLGYETWERFFSASPAVIGDAITLDGERYRVAGVMPKAFHFPSPDTAFWVPLLIDAGGSRGMLLPTIARLRPDATLPAVLAEGRNLLGGNDGSGEETTLVARTLQDQLVGGVERVLWILMGAVAFVTVIATVNIALLLLVRGATREREFSVRLALGARRAQLARQLFIEAIALASLGGVAGLVLAHSMLKMLLQLAPDDMPRLQDATLNAPALVFGLAVTLVTSVIFGVLSAGRTMAVDPARALAGSGGESRLLSARTPRRRLSALAAGELALTMVLLVGAGLLLRSFVALLLINHGFDSRGALALQINLPASRYPNPAARLAFHQRLLERLKATEAVRVAGLITSMPNRQPSGRFDYDAVPVPVVPDPLNMHIAGVRMATDGFVEAMGIPLLAGRTFRPQDDAGGEQVMVISASLAKVHFPSGDAVGRLLYSRTGTRRVIGVVGDVRPAAAEVEAVPAAYLPIGQDDSVFRWYSGINVVVRGSDPASLAPVLRTLILSMDPEMPPYNVRTLDAEVSELVAGPRFSALVLAIFAVVAMVLAAVGISGVIAYCAGERTREIGVRIALGATRAQVLRLMLRDGVVVVAVGVLAGSVAAIWLAQALTGMLYDVRPADPITLVSVAAILSAAGLLAAYIPARRATRGSPLDALRTD
jgi:putative ABC transport system permease protein